MLEKIVRESTHCLFFASLYEKGYGICVFEFLFDFCVISPDVLKSWFGAAALHCLGLLGFLLDFRRFEDSPGWGPESTRCGDVKANPGPDLSKISLLRFAERLCVI